MNEESTEGVLDGFDKHMNNGWMLRNVDVRWLIEIARTGLVAQARVAQLESQLETYIPMPDENSTAAQQAEKFGGPAPEPAYKELTEKIAALESQHDRQARAYENLRLSLTSILGNYFNGAKMTPEQVIAAIHEAIEAAPDYETKTFAEIGLEKKLAESEVGRAVAKTAVAIEEAVKGYFCKMTTCANNGGPLPLVDKLTAPGDDSILSGIEERDALIDEICGAVLLDKGTKFLTRLAELEEESREWSEAHDKEKLERLVAEAEIRRLSAIIARAAELVARGEPIPRVRKFDNDVHERIIEEWINYARALAMVVAQRDWEPIDTAPKDGTLLLLLIKGTCGPDVGHWFQATNNGWWTSHTMPVEPTHWIPIPTPPNPPAGEQGGAALPKANISSLEHGSGTINGHTYIENSPFHNEQGGAGA